MQISKRMSRPIFFLVICFSFLVIIPCAANSDVTPSIPLDINSSSGANTTPHLSYQIPPPDDTASQNTGLAVLHKNQRFAPLNPDFIAYQKKAASIPNSAHMRSDLSSENGYRGLGFIPLTADLSFTKGQDVTEFFQSYSTTSDFFLTGPPYPSRFDLRTLGKVTPVKDQGSAGSCWAFASYASLESTLLTNESWNFSENNMKNLLSSSYPDGFDRIASGGGNALMSTAYLARWTGPVRDGDDPYVDVSTTSPTNISAVKHVQNVLFLPDRANATDNENIKSALMTHGVVYTSMYWSGLYFNDTSDAYYYPLSSDQNHAVGIVGWDDQYSRFNFTSAPPGDGAFIVKNSWSTVFGEQGYFYVSYYDTFIGSNNAVFTAESVQNYDRIYQYDPLGWVTNFGNSGNPHSQWGANIFTSNSTESLSAVSFYTTDTNTTYDLYIYKNPDNGPVNTSGYLFHENGIIAGPSGYYTKVIRPGITLLENDKFSVVMNLTSKNSLYPLPIEYEWPGYSSQARASPGQSYYSDDNGLTWIDMTSFDSSANICFKAFTNLTPPVAAFSANVTSGHAPLTVEFSDLSTGSVTGWTWSFGDGNVTDGTVQNPVHTYMSGGKFTVSLTASNGGRSNTTTKTQYISVIGGTDGIAVFRPSSGYWYFDYNNDGTVDNSFLYGKSGDQIIKGDWQGTGADGIAVFRPSSGNWYFDYNNDGTVDNSFSFGKQDDQPISGNWSGTGADGIAVFRPSSGNWYFDYNNDGTVDNSFLYGKSGDQIIKGDWQGTGADGIAVFRPSSGNWYFDYNNDGTVDNSFSFGKQDDQPISGNWSGTGADGIAVFRPSSGNWYFDYYLDGMLYQSYNYGKLGDQIVKADWLGTGKEGIAVFRQSNGYWYLDYNLDGIVDNSFRFGKPGDQAIVGKWA